MSNGVIALISVFGSLGYLTVGVIVAALSAAISLGEEEKGRGRAYLQKRLITDEAWLVMVPFWPLGILYPICMVIMKSYFWLVLKFIGHKELTR